MDPIVPWALALMLQAAPPAPIAAAPAFMGWEETAEQRTERYVAIEHAAHAAAFDPAERPLFAGPRGRGLTEAMLLAVSNHESGWARDVDLGPCYPQRDKRTGYIRCDGGMSVCMMQVRMGARLTAEGWTKEELFADREKCFRAGLHKLRRGRCPHNEPRQLWAGYASGDCKKPSLPAAELADTFKRFTSAPMPRVPLDSEAANDTARVTWNATTIKVVAAR